MSSSLTEMESRVYRAYRHTLKSFPRNSYNRPGARKQKAREIVSVRYHVPISAVKEIVARGEKIDGIEHNHTEEYAQMLPYTMAMRTAMRDFQAHPVKVCVCGSTDAVAPRFHQYYSKTEDKPVIVTSCFGCWERTAEDI